MIVTNCGEEPSVVLNQVKQGTGSYRYNAATGEYGDMIEMDEPAGGGMGGMGGMDF